ncbi:threonine/serine dehydratase [Thalassobacillus pellis]|uniref:threonine/serine dehydratase n=1 Tax=Thalassobacillus pellis TaxID=748008 RepID=UPI0019601F3E|nr:threonine/serine dehydratase [Thalassobacillus pellis]MBM7554152.1 threonine dehydratase [Thalassobacillus pellis]
MIHIADIIQARETIENTIHTTPILQSDQLSRLCNNDVFLKAEHLQKTGSFKIRGATNKVTEAVRAGAESVTAASSGNHGQAVAYIADSLGVPATIVVPEDATPCKVDAIRAYKGKIETCGTTSAERIPQAKMLAEKTSGVYIPPYDDPYTMAGQGTVGMEIMEQIEDVDAVVVPVGGGGLLSGILTAIKETQPRIKVYGVEPETANDTFLSLKNGKITTIPPTQTIADGLRASQPGDLTFPVLQKYLDDLFLVSEKEIKLAFSFVMERMKQLIEPSSAVAVAAIMNNKLPFEGKKMAVVISGGNVDIRKIGEMTVDTVDLC